MSQIFELFNHHILFLIFSQIVFFTVGFLLLVPLIKFGFEVSLLTSGLNFLSLSNMFRFVLNPLTLLFFLLIFIALSVFLVFEDSFLKDFFFLRHKEIPIRRWSLIITAIQGTLKTFKSLNLKSVFYIWALLFSFNLPFIVFSVRSHPLLRYVVSETSQIIVWTVILALYVICVLIIQKRNKSNLIKHAAWNIMQGFFFLILYIVVLIVILFLVSLLIPRSIGVAAFISVYNRFNGLFSFTIFVLSTLSHYAFYTVISSETLLLVEEDVLKQPIVTPSSYFRKPLRLVVLGLLSGLLIFDMILYLDILRNGSLLQTISLDQVMVTSHRGYSFSYPENTIIAIERAIEVYADYVEVDVRVTQDRQFVLLHDDNLLRTTGVNVSVSKLPFVVVNALDAGKWLNAKFAGETIPSLQEALETTKGRVNLNLDLKFSERQVDLIPDLVALIDEYDMQFQVILTSTCLVCLEKAKEINPNIQTGLITYRVTPSLLANPLIDIVSMKATFVTQSIVQEVQNSNKIILVWTVNTRAEIERLSSFGVNNIITSRPAYVREILFELNADRFIMNLIRIILN